MSPSASTPGPTPGPTPGSRPGSTPPLPPATRAAAERFARDYLRELGGDPDLVGGWGDAMLRSWLAEQGYAIEDGTVVDL